MSNQWSDNLRKRMEEHQEPSPKMLWADLEQIMQKEHSAKFPTKEKKVLLWSKRIGAIAAVAIIALILGYYSISDQNKENIELAIETHEGQDMPGIERNTPNQEKNLTAKNDNHSFSEKTRTQAQTKTTETDTTILSVKDQENINNNIPNTSVPESESKANLAENNQSNKKTIQSLTTEYDTDFSGINQKEESTKWAANLYASNLSSGATSKFNGYGSLSHNERDLQGYEEEPLTQENSYGQILIQNKYREVYTDVKHRQPITMGISVNYRLDERWSLASGLTYTTLSSKLRSGSDNYFYNSEQTLRNIGIPLSINYNIWGNRKLSIYLSGGGILEKNVSGKLTTDYIVDKKLESSRTENISIDQLQWAVNTSLGVQYNLTKRIGLYVEPGASYHFKNGSEIETIYKEKPLNMSLRFGLNFSIGNK